MTSHSDHLADLDNGSWPDLATLAVGGPQPGWVVIDTARNSRFTGELAFRHEPAISVFFDNGLAYHAVRQGDPSLCDRLIEEGVVDPTQVERGVIRVGSVENLGRLFDRDPSIDRDAVLVVMELATDVVISTIANAPATTFVPTAYRHHVSGVHRWFVGPNAPTQLTPVGEVSQIDASVTSRLPGTHVERVALQVLDDDDDVEIEWDHPSTFVIDRPTDDVLQSILNEDTAAREAEIRRARAAEEQTERSAYERASRTADERAERDAQDRAARRTDERLTLLADDRAAHAAAADFDPDTADWTRPAVASIESSPTPITLAAQPQADHDPSPSVAVGPSPTPSEDAEFQITWPDGTAQSVREASAAMDSGPTNTVEPPPALVRPVMPEPVLGAPGDSPSEDDAVPDPPEHDQAAAPPPLLSVPLDVRLQGQPEAVQDAVQRALDAIHSAAAHEPSVAPMLHLVETPALEAPAVETPAAGIEPSASDAVLDVVPEPSAPLAAPAPSTALPPSAPPPPTTAGQASPFAGFAPPTLESSAEVMYARAESDPATGEPTVVFVDESDGDRSGALRRLIGSIRRK